MYINKLQSLTAKYYFVEYNRDYNKKKNGFNFPPFVHIFCTKIKSRVSDFRLPNPIYNCMHLKQILRHYLNETNSSFIHFFLLHFFEFKCEMMTLLI